LIAFPCTKNARRIFAIVSTTNIPTWPPRIVEANVDPPIPGSRLDADHPEMGVLFARRFTLQEIDNPRIVHYGAYEKRFLRRMMERWKTTAEEAHFINRIGDGSINLLASIYGKIYFPTYSNSLKEIGRWLGFEWSCPQASGQAATLLRRLWELSPDDTLRDRLIRYNMEDCRAIALIGGTIAQICDTDSGHKWTVVNTSELEVGSSEPSENFRVHSPISKRLMRQHTGITNSLRYTSVPTKSADAGPKGRQNPSMRSWLKRRSALRRDLNPAPSVERRNCGCFRLLDRELSLTLSSRARGSNDGVCATDIRDIAAQSAERRWSRF